MSYQEAGARHHAEICLRGIQILNCDRRLSHLASQPYEDKRIRSIWMQIYDRLEMAMTTGLLPEGSKLPGEDDLASLFGVSRVTLRRALALHQREGRLVSRKGVGVFVRSIAIRYVVHENEAFNAPLSGEDSMIETLSLGPKPASGDAAAAFGLPHEAEIIELEMLQFSGNSPYYLAIKEFPPAILPNFAADFVRTGTILDAYAAAGISNYFRTETRIIGDFATHREAELLRISKKAPVIRSRSINKDEQGRVIEYNRGCWPMFSVELVFETT